MPNGLAKRQTEETKSRTRTGVGFVIATHYERNYNNSMKYQKLEELSQANILLNFLNLSISECLKVTGTKEPPDFVLNDDSGLEVTQVIDRNLKQCNSCNDELLTTIRKALYNEKSV